MWAKEKKIEPENFLKRENNIGWKRPEFDLSPSIAFKNIVSVGKYLASAYQFKEGIPVCRHVSLIWYLSASIIGFPFLFSPMSIIFFFLV